MPLESRQESRQEYRRVACDRCGGATNFAAQVSPLGNEPGVRIYHCPTCTCFTVVEWGGSRPEARPQVEHMRSASASPIDPTPQRAQRHQQKATGSGG